MFEWKKEGGSTLGVQYIGDKVIEHPKMWGDLQAGRQKHKEFRAARALAEGRIKPDPRNNRSYSSDTRNRAKK